MLWRTLVIFVTLFWLVMVVLLVRVTYYPEGSQFARLPPRTVLKMFLDRGASGKQLHLYHGETKIGHLTVDIRQSVVGQGADDCTLMLSGMVDKGGLAVLAGAINWRVNINLHDAQRWAGAGGQVRMPDDGLVLNFKWEAGQSAPHFTLSRRGVMQADDSLLQPLLSQINAGTGSVSPEAAQDSIFQVSAREGSMKIAGQRRKGYVIGFNVMEQYRATAFFTEDGDLALIELPDGYRALEPNIHGLVPDDPEE